MRRSAFSLISLFYQVYFRSLPIGTFVCSYLGSSIGQYRPSLIFSLIFEAYLWTRYYRHSRYTYRMILYGLIFIIGFYLIPIIGTHFIKIRCSKWQDLKDLAKSLITFRSFTVISQGRYWWVGWFTAISQNTGWTCSYYKLINIG